MFKKLYSVIDFSFISQVTYKLSARYIYLCFFGMQILFTDYFYLKKIVINMYTYAHFDF